jgi:hypothetical protein
MKRLISAVLALSLAGSSVAMAAPFGGHDGRAHNTRGHTAQRYDHNRGHNYGYRNRDNGGAAALGFGLLALGLFAGLASQNQDRAYDPGYSYAPPPPAYGGYGYDYGPGYGGYYGR